MPPEDQLAALFNYDVSDPHAHEVFRQRLTEFIAELKACGSSFDVTDFVEAGIRKAQADAVKGHPALAALERDAERYRWLRGRDLDTINNGGVFVGKVPENLVLNGIDCDAAVDAARIAEQIAAGSP